MKKIFLCFVFLSFFAAAKSQTGCISGNCQNGFGTYFWDADSKKPFEKYIGQWKGGKPSGKGTYYWSNGDRYEGEWFEGKRNGNGMFFSANGTQQKGFWDNDEFVGSSVNEGCLFGNCDNGKGIYSWTDNDQYAGEWKEGKKNGYGIYSYNDGSKFIGEFLHGKRNGYGILSWNNGDVYIGEWFEDKQHGIGAYFYADSTYDFGTWQNGKFTGKIVNATGCVSGNCENLFGIFISKQGEKYSGNWKNKFRNGQGTQIYSNGAIYEGEWFENQRNGLGTLIYPDGTAKTGIWEKDKFVGSQANRFGCISGNCENGNGIFRYQNGDIYSGNFLNGKKSGFGTMIFANKNKYIGQWQNDQPNGKGTLFSPSGITQTGIWKNGQFAGIPNVAIFCAEGDCQNGEGRQTLDSTEIYFGHFKEGEFDSWGIQQLLNGNFFAGEFRKNTFNGWGILKTEASDELFIGKFLDGQPSGAGISFKNRNVQNVGFWKKGVFVEQKIISKKNPSIQWSSKIDTISNHLIYTARACISAENELKSIEIFVNDKLQISTLPIGISTTQTCEYFLEKNISLIKGKNTLKIDVKSTNGTFSSSLKTIFYKPISKNKPLALIIGNSKYSEYLSYGAMSAKTVSSELKKFGFEVTLLTDLTFSEMKNAISDFAKKLSETKTAGLCYFSGYSMQVNEENYLLPANFSFNGEEKMDTSAINLNRMIGEMEFSNSLTNILILDCFSPHSFNKNLKNPNAKGLTAASVPANFFITYSASPNTFAITENNAEISLFTKTFIENLKNEGISLTELFKKINNSVLQKSNNQQVPWQRTTLLEEFYFPKK